jgi:hypothetical protein
LDAFVYGKDLNRAVMRMEVPLEVGVKHGNPIPKTAPFEVLTRLSLPGVKN